MRCVFFAVVLSLNTSIYTPICFAGTIQSKSKAELLPRSAYRRSDQIKPEGYNYSFDDVAEITTQTGAATITTGAALSALNATVGLAGVVALGTAKTLFSKMRESKLEKDKQISVELRTNKISTTQANRAYKNLGMGEKQVDARMMENACRQNVKDYDRNQAQRAAEGY